MIGKTGILSMVAGLALLAAGPSFAGGMTEPGTEPEVVVDPAPVGDDDGMVYAGGDPDFDESGGGEGEVVDGGDDGTIDEGVDLPEDDDFADDGVDDEVPVETGDGIEGVYYMTGGATAEAAPHSAGRATLAPQAARVADNGAAGPTPAYCRALVAKGVYGDCGWLFAQGAKAD